MLRDNLQPKARTTDKPKTGEYVGTKFKFDALEILCKKFNFPYTNIEQVSGTALFWHIAEIANTAVESKK